MGFEETFRSVGLTLSRSTSFISHAFLFGLLPILALVLRPAFRRVDAEAWGKSRVRISARLEGLVQSALTATALATLIALILQFALVSEVQGGDITSQPVVSVLETRFGQLYLLRFPLLAGLGVLLVGRVRVWSLSGAGDGGKTAGRAWWIGWGALAAGLLLTSTLSGHSAVATPMPLAAANDLLHLICGGIWFSGIVVLALVLPDGWRGRTADERVRLLAPIIVRFSTVALVTITVLGITGVLNSYLHVQQLDDMFDTPYGRAISAKIVVYLGILAVGGINHFFVRGRLEKALEEGRSDNSQSLFRKTIAIELVMALSVMGISGFLTGQARTKETVEAPDTGEGVTARRTP